MSMLFFGEPPKVPVSYNPKRKTLSQEGKKLWRAEYLEDKGQIEIRRQGLVIVVSLDGYSYKKWYRTGKHVGKTKFQKEDARIHIASSDAQQLTWEEWYEMQTAVEEAKMLLEVMKTYPEEVLAAIKENRIHELLGK